MELENKPKDTNLAQQRIPPWQFYFIPKFISLFYLFTGVLGLSLGLLLLFASNSTNRYQKQYNTKCQSQTTCSINLSITSDLHGDVFFYYEVHGMYQNHREYSKSLSVGQMQGHNMIQKEVNSVCEPITKVKDLHLNPKNFSLSMVANPCGLISNSFFTDSFKLFDNNGKQIEIHEDDIAFETDKNEKFKNSNGISKKRWIDVTDEHFIVWTSVAPLPWFRKLWGRINGLDKGKYRVEIENRFDVSRFSGKKFVRIETMSVVGGENLMLAWVVIGIGSASVLASVLFGVEFCVDKRMMVR